MKGIILAAGLGSRLLEHTKDIPKCLIKIGDKTLLEHQINALKNCGIKDIVIVTGFYGEKIVDAVKDMKDVNIKFIENPLYKTTSSGHSLWLARDEISDGFVYINSDLFFHPEILKKLVDSKHKNAIIIKKEFSLKESDMQKLIFDKKEENKIKYMGRDVHIKEGEAIGIGPVKFGSEGAKLILNNLKSALDEGNKEKMYCYSVFGASAIEHPFHGVETGGLPWTEIDTPEELEKARNKILPLIEKN